MIRARILLLLALLVPLLGSTSREGVPTGFELWTPKSVSPQMVEMVAEAPSDPHQFAVRLLGDFPNDSFLLVHRAADGRPEWHETQADVFGAQSG